MFGSFQIQINIVLCVLLISLFFHAYFKMNRKTITNRLFMWIMGMTCFILVFEVFSVLLNVPGMKNWITLNKLVNLAGFMFAPLIPFFGYLFCIEWIKRFRNTESEIRVNYISLLPIAINVVFSVVSYNGGQLYSITDNNEYIRGPLFFVLPGICFIYFIVSLYFIFGHRRKYTLSERILFSMIFITPAFLTIVQLWNSSYLTIWNSTAIVVILTYVIILNDQIYRDSLTGLENRLAYEQFIQKLNKNNFKRIYMIYIDIDNFKNINDRFGHSEGDEALKIFANLIIDNFQLRHKKILRVGGDEFLIIIKDKNEEKIKECLKNLKTQIEDYNSRKEKPYEINYSYGLEQYSDAFESMNQLLDHVDHKMYKHKLSKKKSKVDLDLLTEMNEATNG